VTVALADLRAYSTPSITGHRLVNAKVPPIALFEDVASSDEFEALYALQALTNPRIQTELGSLKLISLDEIPFGIRGCHYATAPFTHINPDGSRFSDGSYGLLYVADTADTAVDEVRYHQYQYWSNVPELHYERFVFKELVCTFSAMKGLDASHIVMDDPIYSANNYRASKPLGLEIKLQNEHSALKFNAVRNPGGECHALFSPQEVSDVVQASHYEMVWSGSDITTVNVLSHNTP
jgi:hypothetical protein